MKTVPANLRLTEFPTVNKRRAVLSEMPVSSEADLQPTDIIAPGGSRQELDQVVDDARHEARAEAEAEFSQQLQQVRDEFEQRIAREREQTAQQQAELLAANIDEQFDVLSNELAERFFEQCRPVLVKLARDLAIEELVEVMDAVVTANCGLDISGPAELLDPLRQRLSDKQFEINWQEQPTADVSVRVGDIFVETRLSQWLSGAAGSVHE